MASIGINFRSTSAHATDTGIDVPCAADGGDTTLMRYPVTSGTFSFGWVSPDHTTVSIRDRTYTGMTPPFGGVHYYGNNQATVHFRVELPATGDYEIRAAFGDQASETTNYVVFKDDTTVFGSTIAGVYAAADSFCDANGDVYTRANWPASNTAITRTFASTTFIIELTSGTGGGGGGTNTGIAHLEIASVEGGPTLVKYYPTADKSNAGSWTGEGDETTNLYSHLDETTPSDSDYIQSPTNPTNAVIEFSFGTMTNPPVDGTSHTIRYRMGASGTLDGLVELVAGDDYVVQSWTHEPVAARVAGVDNLFEQTVSTTNTALWLTHGYDGSYIRFTAGT